MKMSINMERPSDEVDYNFLVLPFHAAKINGMDTCIKKPLIVTASADKSIKVWTTSGNSCNLQINH